MLCGTSTGACEWTTSRYVQLKFYRSIRGKLIAAPQLLPWHWWLPSLATSITLYMIPVGEPASRLASREKLRLFIRPCYNRVVLTQSIEAVVHNAEAFGIGRLGHTTLLLYTNHDYLTLTNNLFQPFPTTKTVRFIPLLPCPYATLAQ